MSELRIEKAIGIDCSRFLGYVTFYNGSCKGAFVSQSVTTYWAIEERVGHLLHVFTFGLIVIHTMPR